MRRIICIVFCILLSAGVFAGNSQTTFLMTDRAWKMADIVCRMNGVLGPTPVSPTTKAEIEVALNRLADKQLSEESQKYLDRISEEFGYQAGWYYQDKSLILDPSLKVNPQFYFFNNDKDTMESEYILRFKDRDPLMILDVDTSVFDSAYFYFQFAFMDNPATFRLDESGKQVSGGDYFHNLSNFASFINPGLNWEWTGSFVNNNGNAGTGLFTQQPLKALGSFGNSNMNFFIGRSKQEFGNGVTGNLMIGDNFSYQEFMKISYFTDVFTFHMSLTHYDNAEDNQSFRFGGYHQNRTIQRFDFAIANKLRLAVNLGAHIYSPSMFDWRMIMPMMFVHNWGNNSESIELAPGDECNYIAGLELEWIANKYLMFSAQALIDQFRLPMERGSVVPSAYGLLANMKILTPISQGVFNTWIEFVYTNPYLYLNYKKNADGTDNYCLDHIAGYYWHQSGKGELDYLGYTYGPDSIVLSLGTEFLSFNKLNAAAELQYRIHGQMGIGPNRNMSNRDVDDNTKLNTPTGIPEHTLQLSISGNYQLLSGLSFNCTIADRLQWNYHNESGVFRHSIQSAIGMRWIAF